MSTGAHHWGQVFVGVIRTLSKAKTAFETSARFARAGMGAAPASRGLDGGTNKKCSSSNLLKIIKTGIPSCPIQRIRSTFAKKIKLMKFKKNTIELNPTVKNILKIVVYALGLFFAGVGSEDTAEAMGLLPL